ncbi:MAG: hypothetical protein C4297_05420 [Gemmataceae bacterium]
MHRQPVPWILTLALLFAAGSQLAAHPVPRDHHDRSILVEITPQTVRIHYHLAVSEWTLVKDLVPYRDQVDFASSMEQLFDKYGAIYAAVVAEGLLIELDGQPARLQLAGRQYAREDHIRFTFRYEIPLPVPVAGKTYQLTLVDGNFAMEPGLFKLAATVRQGVALLHSSVAADLDRAPVYDLADFSLAQDESLRTANVRFRVDRADEPSSLFGEDYGQGGVSRWPRLSDLLDTRWGTGAALLLAFVFGAFHALQPGHGKTLVAAYLVGEQGTVLHAVFLGVVTTLTHTGVVLLLALVLPMLAPRATGEVAFAISLGCGMLIVLLALWMLLRRLAGQADHIHLFGGHRHEHPASVPEQTQGQRTHAAFQETNDQAPGVRVEPLGKPVTWGALVLLGATGGMIPCVDALALLAAAWITGRVWLAVPLILAFSAGLASVLVAVGIAVVQFKRYAQARWGEGRLVRWLPILGALPTLLLGLWMCH